MLKDEIFIPGEAFILDHQFATTRSLVDSTYFTKENITCVEYDEATYKEAAGDKKFGQCMVYGEFLNELKKKDFSKLSLIYGDFTVTIKNGGKPLGIQEQELVFHL